MTGFLLPPGEDLTVSLSPAVDSRALFIPQCGGEGRGEGVHWFGPALLAPSPQPSPPLVSAARVERSVVGERECVDRRTLTP
jgi:hypothetical protein